MAQSEAEEIFNEKFAELNNELKFNPNIKDLSPKAVADYRNVLKKLDDAVDDLVAFEVGALTDENTKVFEYKTLRKAKDITGLKPLIIEHKHKIKEYMGDKTQYGADSLECIKNIALLQQSTKSGNWAVAYVHWNILFHYYPRASRTTYSKGTDIVEFKYGKEKDAAIKNKWVDTLMMIYDQRIKFATTKKYPKGYILGRKAVDLLKYRPTSFEQAYSIFEESVKLQGVESEEAVLLTFMQATDGMFRAEKIEASVVVDNNSKLTDLLTQKAKIETKNPNIQTALDGVEAIFTNSPASTCEALIPVYEKKFNANMNDVETLKKIATMLDKKECTEKGELFFKVVLQLDKLQPSAISKIGIAYDYIRKKDYENATVYINEAIKLETEDTLKAKYYFKLAQVSNEMGQKSQAKAQALKAASLKSNYGAPYILIATMYASSGCSQLTSPEGELGNVGYWAAVDKLVKARSVDPSVADAASSLISRYSGGFPNAEKAFMIGVTKGKTVTIGCWINETTTARF